jgi:nicotinate-nucleotide adenylyltransferase
MTTPHASTTPESPSPPVPAGATTLILFGGSFDPPHAGHQTIARHALAATAPDSWLLFIPAARSPFKERAPQASDADRLAMLRCVVASEPRTSVWEDELRRTPEGEASYTIDTVRRAAALFPGTRLRLLIGADQAVSLHRWREPHELVATAPPLIACREHSAATFEHLLDSLRLAQAWNEGELLRLREGLLPCPLVDASSTEIRRDLAGAGERLHPDVLRYARSHRLYGS